MFYNKEILNNLFSLITNDELVNTELNLYLQNNGDINAVNEDGLSLLMHSIINNNLTNTLLLINNGANVNHQDHDGYTALFYAALNCDFEAVELLLNNNANLYHKDKRNYLITDILKFKMNLLHKKMYNFLLIQMMENFYP